MMKPELDAQPENATGHRWMETSTASAAVETKGDTPASLWLKPLSPQLPPGISPFTRHRSEILWNNYKTCIGLLITLNALATAALLSTGILAEDITVITALLSLLAEICAVIYFRNRFEAAERDRLFHSVNLYFERAGWTKSNYGSGTWTQYWILDLGYERGVVCAETFCLVEPHAVKCNMSGQCSHDIMEQLTHSLSLLCKKIEIDTHHVRIRNLAIQPTDGARLKEIGYGHMGWIGNGAILRRYGDPAYATHSRAQIHRDSFLHPRPRRHGARSEELLAFMAYDHALWTIGITAERFLEAQTRAFERAWEDGARPGATVAIIYNSQGDHLLAVLLELPRRSRRLNT